MPFLFYETINGDDYGNYYKMELMMLFADVAPWIKGCDYVASWTRGINDDTTLISGVDISEGGYLHG